MRSRILSLAASLRFARGETPVGLPEQEPDENTRTAGASAHASHGFDFPR